MLTYAIKARKKHGAKIGVIGFCKMATLNQADMGLVLKPSVDAALASAVVHVLFRESFAHRAYIEKYTHNPKNQKGHLDEKTPEWTAQITGLSVEEDEAFLRFFDTTKKPFFRLDYSFLRQNKGSGNMHVVL